MASHCPVQHWAPGYTSYVLLCLNDTARGIFPEGIIFLPWKRTYSRVWKHFLSIKCCIILHSFCHSCYWQKTPKSIPYNVNISGQSQHYFRLKSKEMKDPGQGMHSGVRRMNTKYVKQSKENMNKNLTHFACYCSYQVHHTRTLPCKWQTSLGAWASPWSHWWFGRQGTQLQPWAADK